MISSIAIVLLGAAAVAATPCENLTNLELANTAITSAIVIPEGPPPARGAGGVGGVRGGAPQGAVPVAKYRLAREEVRLRRISRLIAGFSWFSSLLMIP